MENRRTFLRASLIALALLMASAVSSQIASAQDFKCVCDYVTVVTDKDVNCKFEVCNFTGGASYCDVAIPGQRTRLRCLDGATIYVINCRGQRVTINADCKTPQLIALSLDCCVYACVYRDADGCLVVHFSRADAPCDKCL